MKLSFYVDIYPWTTAETPLFPTSKPGLKGDQATRYRIEFEVADPAKPDTTLAVVAQEVAE